MSGLEQRLQDFSLENEKLKQENMTLRKKIELLNSEVSPPFIIYLKSSRLNPVLKLKKQKSNTVVVYLRQTTRILHVG